jgi:hypothetical protein
VAIGTGRFQSQNPAYPIIPFALDDARDVAKFLGAPNGKERYQRVDVQTLLGPAATSEKIEQMLVSLEDRRKREELGRGDAVFVMIESHLLGLDPKGTAGAILTADTGEKNPPVKPVLADRIADELGTLVEYGCKVMLLVDGIHEKRPEGGQSPRALTEWARSLYRKNVITFVASVHGPSWRVPSDGHGAFAQAVLDSMSAQGRSRLIGLNALGDSPFTLFDFQDAVTSGVLRKTTRQQNARCFIPETIPSESRIFDPPSRRPSKALRAAKN